MTLKPCFGGSCFFKTHTGTAFDSEQLEFHLRVGLNQRSCVCQMTLNPILGSCFFKTGTGFDSEQLNFNLKTWRNQRSVVKIHLCLSNEFKAMYLGFLFL